MTCPASSWIMYLTVPMPLGWRLPAIPLIGLIITCHGGEIKSSNLGVIDIDAPVLKSSITPVSIWDRKQC